MSEWANEILEKVGNASSMLDHIHASTSYTSSLATQSAKIADPNLTPSGKILTDMKKGGLSFFEFSLQQSTKHRNELENNGLSEAAEKMMTETAAQSLKKQTEIETLETEGFEEYLKNWNEAQQFLP